MMHMVTGASGREAYHAPDDCRPEYPCWPGATPQVGDGSFTFTSSIWPGTAKVIEEMGEALQVFGKLIGTGGAEEHWDGTNLRQRLVEEVGDVFGSLDFWASANLNVVERVRVGERAYQKKKLFEKWQDEGTL